ncbi:MAG: SpoIIE family protein phosphatase [Coriobacteriia bacterium]|nr:SpoIIE family protein phosphatase [Coriobacteriia bacterium]
MWIRSLRSSGGALSHDIPDTPRPDGLDDARHRDALDAVRDVVVIMDREGRLLDVNRAAEFLYGYDRSALLALSVHDLRTPEARTTFDSQFVAALAGGVTFETTHRRRDGSTFPVEVSASRWGSEDMDCVISVVRDTTARKESEELRARLLDQLSQANARLDGALTLLTSAVGLSELPLLLDSIISALAQVMGADAALFVVHEGDHLDVRAQVGAEHWAPVGTVIPVGEGFAGRVAEAGVPLYIADIRSNPAFLPLHDAGGIRSMFGVPVYADGALFGVLECAWMHGRPVDQAESAMIKLAADRVSLAISGSRLLERTRRSERLNAALNEVNACLNASLELDSALDEVLSIAATALQCEVGVLARASRGEWPVNHTFGVVVPAEGLTFDRELLGAMSSDAPIVLRPSGRSHERWLAEQFDLTEAIVIPVPAHRAVGGALLFGRTGRLSGFDAQQADFVARLSQSLALSLANAARFEVEHHIAETLQEAFLLMPTAIRGIDFAHMYRSATMSMRVGGDFFDVFEMPGGHVGVLVGDVSGKGLEAAVLTSIVKDTIRAYAHETNSPAEAIAHANIALCEAAKLPDFASVFFAVIQPTTGDLTYCNAGHPPAAVIDCGGGVRLLEGNSSVIGAFPDLHYVDSSSSLAADETLFLYTDGVTEARTPQGVFYGEEGLLELLGSSNTCGVSELPTLVFDAVLKFSDGRLSDDIALLACRLTAPE